MQKKLLNRILNFLIAAVWLANGLFCKLLNFVPRHQEIVSSILGASHSTVITKLIGISEIFMCVWIISRYRSKLNAACQIVIIAVMNVLELVLVPHLLLWGKWNSFFAVIFILVIYINEFVCNKKTSTKITNA